MRTSEPHHFVQRASKNSYTASCSIEATTRTYGFHSKPYLTINIRSFEQKFILRKKRQTRQYFWGEKQCLLNKSAEIHIEKMTDGLTISMKSVHAYQTKQQGNCFRKHFVNSFRKNCSKMITLIKQFNKKPSKKTGKYSGEFAKMNMLKNESAKIDVEKKRRGKYFLELYSKMITHVEQIVATIIIFAHFALEYICPVCPNFLNMNFC